MNVFLEKYINIPDLIDKIAKQVHVLNMVKVLEDIGNTKSKFEQNIEHEKVYNTKYQMEFDIMNTIYISNKDNSNEFIIIQKLENEHDLVVQIFIDNNRIKIERIHYKTYKTPTLCINSVEEMIENDILLEEWPFFVFDADIPIFDYMYHSGKSWFSIENIFNWFTKMIDKNQKIVFH